MRIGTKAQEVWVAGVQTDIDRIERHRQLVALVASYAAYEAAITEAVLLAIMPAGAPSMTVFDARVEKGSVVTVHPSSDSALLTAMTGPQRRRRHDPPFDTLGGGATPAAIATHSATRKLNILMTDGRALAELVESFGVGAMVLYAPNVRQDAITTIPKVTRTAALEAHQRCQSRPPIGHALHGGECSQPGLGVSQLYRSCEWAQEVLPALPELFEKAAKHAASPTARDVEAQHLQVYLRSCAQPKTAPRVQLELLPSHLIEDDTVSPDYRPAARYLYFHHVVSLLYAKKLSRKGWSKTGTKPEKIWATPRRYLRACMLRTLALQAIMTLNFHRAVKTVLSRRRSQSEGKRGGGSRGDSRLLPICYEPSDEGTKERYYSALPTYYVIVKRMVAAKKTGKGKNKKEVSEDGNSSFNPAKLLREADSITEGLVRIIESADTYLCALYLDGDHRDAAIPKLQQADTYFVRFEPAPPRFSGKRKIPVGSPPHLRGR
ncbi:MAG: hypothetical protein M1826_006734 [Phylliscum demangeonii]|nr:MAG: hypothetical protein M1826_006734 [Phylliscum demangeonii]